MVNTIPNQMTWDVVLSYANEDALWVQSLNEQLQAGALRILDPNAIPPEFWGHTREQILRSIVPQRCRAVLIVLSRAYASNEYCLQELATLTMTSSTQTILLPVRLDSTPVPTALGRMAILDARTATLEQLVAYVTEQATTAATENRPPVAEPRVALNNEVLSAIAAHYNSLHQYARRRLTEAEACEVLWEASRSLSCAGQRTIEYPRAYVHLFAVPSCDSVDPHEQSAVEQLLMTPEGREQLRSAVDQLPAEDRELIDTVYYQLVPRYKVAEQRGVPNFRVDEQVARALKYITPLVAHLNLQGV